MLPESWFDREALISGKLNRYFVFASWAEVAALFACIFLVYCWYSISLGRTNFLQNTGLKVFLSLIGASGAFGSIFLSEGMWKYWKNYDTSPERLKRMWYWIMRVFLIFGCAAYFRLIYEPQVDRANSPNE